MTRSRLPGSSSDDRCGAREPTSHERLSGRPWDASYHDGPAPWDIGRPQPAVVRVAAAGLLRGSVVDAGCGTGENACYLASLGSSVLGVDVAETALGIARAKAEDRGLEVEFLAADGFELERLGRMFATVLDCALFSHLRRRRATALRLEPRGGDQPHGTLYVLCFSDGFPDTGPHPVSREELERRSIPVADERHRNRSGTGAHALPRRSGRTRLARDDQTDLGSPLPGLPLESRPGMPMSPTASQRQRRQAVVCRACAGTRTSGEMQRWGRGRTAPPR